MTVPSDDRCAFCGKSRNEARTLVVGSEAGICAECIVGALDTISRQRGHIHVRIAFLIFRAVAVGGRLLGLGEGRGRGAH
jgi:ClpX C4-type zinc finger protein